MLVAATAPATANAAIQLRGSFSERVLKPHFTGLCAPEVEGNQCGVIQLDGLGSADFAYLFGPTFEPTGKRGCFLVDGTFTLTLQSDASSVTGPLTGVFCEPGLSGPGGGGHSYGKPFKEDDTITFTSGTGQFLGLFRRCKLPPVQRWGCLRGHLGRDPHRLTDPLLPRVNPPLHASALSLRHGNSTTRRCHHKRTLLPAIRARTVAPVSERTEAIEKATATGCGVLAICHLGVWMVGPSRVVPCGELHEFLSMNDWYAGQPAWVEFW
jgi:hypothetical protein